MSDLELFIIGCIVFSPVLFVLFTTFQELQDNSSEKARSNQNVNNYLKQIGFSLLLISTCVLMGIIIF
jgi:CHASE3 domain sensor protein